MDDFDMLMDKLNNVLRLDDIKSDNKIISVYDAVCMLRNALNEYNNKFIYENYALIQDINKSAFIFNLFKGDIPKVKKITPCSFDNGLILIEVTFTDIDKKYKGQIIIDEKLKTNVTYMKEEYDKETVLSILKDYESKFKEYIELLAKFRSNYPNISYEWNSDFVNKKQIIKEKFITTVIDLDFLDDINLYFTNSFDLEVSKIRTKKYGEIYDYLDFYKDEIMKKLKVNIKDLDIIYQTLINKELKSNNSLLLKK